MSKITIEAPGHARWLIDRIDKAGSLTDEQRERKRAAVSAEVCLALPTDPIIPREIRHCTRINWIRGTCAALGVAWAAGGTLHRPVTHYAGVPLPYGGAVYGELTARGWTDAEIDAAALDAYTRLIEPALLTQVLMDDAAGNLESDASKEVAA